jgi:hypothetical protein
MIVRRLLLPIKAREPFKNIFDHILDSADGGEFKVGFKFAMCSDRGPAIGAGNDGIIGWVIGDDDSGAPAYFALRGNGKIDGFAHLGTPQNYD